MKKLTLALTFVLSASYSYAQVDYSKLQPTNPYSRYEFRSGEEWRELKKQELATQQPRSKSSQGDYSYFSNNMVNPVTASKSVVLPKQASTQSSKGKYKHLAEHQHRIGACWDKAGATYKIDPWLLMAYAKTESSFNPNAVNKANKNGSVDYGMMQINSIWLPTLKKHNITKDDLLEPCVSIFVGAWIAAQNIKHFGYNVDGIGAYNSRTVSIRRNYAAKVYANYESLVKDLYKK